MASSYTYVGDEPRYYPDSGVHAVPASGDTAATTATFDSHPGDGWVSSNSKKAAAVKADGPEAPPAPAADTTPKA